MIIFDLDGTLANHSHRKHFIENPEDQCGLCYEFLMNKNPKKDLSEKCLCGRQPGLWKKDYKSYYEFCDRDEPIKKTINVFNALKLKLEKTNVKIWTGRCESVRDKTECWLRENIPQCSWFNNDPDLKMRPKDNTLPDFRLKEMWLDQAFAQRDEISSIFDSKLKAIKMWKYRGIFVFNCHQ